MLEKVRKSKGNFPNLAFTTIRSYLTSVLCRPRTRNGIGVTRAEDNSRFSTSPEDYSMLWDCSLQLRSKEVSLSDDAFIVIRWFQTTRRLLILPSELGVRSSYLHWKTAVTEFQAYVILRAPLYH